MSFLAVLFWLIVIFSFLGLWVPPLDRQNRIAFLVCLVCIAILGVKVFGNPLTS